MAELPDLVVPNEAQSAQTFIQPSDNLSDDMGLPDIVVPNAPSTSIFNVAPQAEIPSPTYSQDDVPSFTPESAEQVRANASAENTLNSIFGTPQNVDVPQRDDLSTGQEVARLAVRAPFPTFALEEAMHRYGDPNSGFLTALSRFNQALPLQMGEEFNAVLDTVADMVTGNVYDNPDQGYFSDLYDEYQFNRDFRRKQIEVQSKRNPKAGALGEFIGTAPTAALPLGKTVSVAKLGHGFFHKLINSRFLRTTALGEALGFGLSDADIVEDPQGVFNDAAKTAALFGTVYLGAKGLGALKKLVTPKKLTTEGAVRSIAGGGDARRSPDIAGNLEHPNALSKPALGVKVLERDGKVVFQDNVITNIPAKTLSGKGFVKNPLKQTGEALHRHIAMKPQKNLIDYETLMSDLSESISKRETQALALLKSAYGKQKIPAKVIIGPNASAKSNALFKNLIRIKQNRKMVIGTDDDDLESINYLLRALKKDGMTIDEWVRFKTELGSTIGGKFWTQGAKPGTPTAAAMDDFFQIRQNMRLQVQSKFPHAAKQFADLEDEMSNLLALKEVAKNGSKLFRAERDSSTRFARGWLADTVMDVSGGNSPQHVGLSELLGSGVLLAEKGIRGVTALGEKALNPRGLYWMSRLFPSFNSGSKKISDIKEKEVALHYLQTNDNLSPRQKTILAHKLKLDGTFDPKYVPREVKTRAEEEADEINMSAWDAGSP